MLAPEEPDRCRKVGVPEAVPFATKTEIALSQIQRAHASALPRGTVVADAGHGHDAELRAGITDAGPALHGGGQEQRQGLGAPDRAAPPGTLRRTRTAAGSPPPSRRASADERGGAGEESACTGVPDPELARGNEHAAVFAVRRRARPSRASQGQARGAGAGRMVADRMAEGRAETQALLAQHPGCQGNPRRARADRSMPLAHRARPPGTRAGIRPRSLRRAELAWLPPPCELVHCRLRLPREPAFARPAQQKTPQFAKTLPFPKITPRGAPRRAQRHVDDSIATLRWQIASAIMRTLEHCPCCSSPPKPPTQ